MLDFYKLAIKVTYRLHEIDWEKYLGALECIRWAETECRQSGAGSECTIFRNECWEDLNKAIWGRYTVSFEEAFNKSQVSVHYGISSGVVGAVGSVIIQHKIDWRSGKVTENTARYIYWLIKSHNLMPIHSYNFVGEVDDTNYDRIMNWIDMLRQMERECDNYRCPTRTIKDFRDFLTEELGGKKYFVAQIAGSELGSVYKHGYLDILKKDIESFGRNLDVLTKEVMKDSLFARHSNKPILILYKRIGAVDSSFTMVDKTVAAIINTVQELNEYTMKKYGFALVTGIERGFEYLDNVYSAAKIAKLLGIETRIATRLLTRSQIIVRAVRYASLASNIVNMLSDFLIATRIIRHTLMAADGPLPFVDAAVLAIDVLDLIINWKDYKNLFENILKATSTITPSFIGAAEYLGQIANGIWKTIRRII